MAAPRPGEVARSTDVREAELRLQLEIEGVRKEIKEVELRLQGEIEGVRKEIEVVRREIVQSKHDLLKWLVPLMSAQVLATAALVKLL